jgi:hypothetical protein
VSVDVTMSQEEFDQSLRKAQVEALEGQYSDGIALAVKVGREAERNRILKIISNHVPDGLIATIKAGIDA